MAIDIVLSEVDLNLYKLKQILSDRQTWSHLKNQIETAYLATGVDLDTIEIENDDQIQITIIDDELDIQILPDTENFSHLGDEIIDDIIVNDQDLYSDSEGDSEPITVQLIDESGQTRAITIDDETSSVDQLRSSNTDFDEESATDRVGIIKSQISQVIDTLTSYKDQLSQLESVTNQNRIEINQAHRQSLSEFDHQIESERNSFKIQQQQIQQQTTLERQREQASQQRYQRDTRLAIAYDRKVTLSVFGSLGVTWFIGIGLSIFFIVQSQMIAFWITTGVVLILTLLMLGGYYYWKSYRRRSNQQVIQIQIQDTEDPLTQANSAIQMRMDQLNSQRNQVDGSFRQRLAALDNDYRSHHQNIVQQINIKYQQAIQHLIPEGQKLLDDWFRFIGDSLNSWHPDWTDAFWQKYNPLQEDVLNGLEHHGLRVGTLLYPNPVVQVPAIVNPLEGLGSQHIFIRNGSNQDRKVELQACLMRLITSMPIGLVRTVLIDNFEQGRALAIFAVRLHKEIVGENRQVIVDSKFIETELKAIYERITSINHHLVNFSSIDEYNKQNPETLFPYQMIVISNFPYGFTPASLQKLKDILRNGPKAGIYILASVADSLPSSRDFDLTEYLLNAYLLDFNTNNTMDWNHEIFSDYNLQPENEGYESLLPGVLDAITRTVEDKPNVIRYERITRELPGMWSKSNTNSLVTPVGLNLGGGIQNLKFERFVAHGLIGGRTGVGKSVLLHDIICGLAQSYHPRDLQMYLLDFKGSEFGVYAKNKLPHASVVAVDCDPELGLRVLEKVENERQARSQLFNNVEANNFEDYISKGNFLPRILVLIDEIHQLTQGGDVEIQNNVKGLMTNLLKQGGGAGIHLLIGTQTPSQVLDAPMVQQIAMRICLLATPDVSGIVLGAGNGAASGLQRQGEAIYNDQNGTPSRNIMFRSALLFAEDAGEITRQLAKRAEEEGFVQKEPLKYFDGLSKSSLLENPRIQALLATGDDPELDQSIMVPIGKSIRLKEDTAVEFARTRFSNLLIVSGDPGLLAISFTNVLLSIGLMKRSTSAEFYIIDLSYRQKELTEILGILKGLPFSFQYAQTSERGIQIFADVYQAFLDRKEKNKNGEQVSSSIFLAIFGMENFSDMRGKDRFDIPKPRKEFDEVMADGPSLGIYVIVASQTLDKGAVIKADSFGNRICYHVSEDDSRAVVDNDVASKMDTSSGSPRAIFKEKASGYKEYEKFKPYKALLPGEVSKVVNLIKERARITGRKHE